MVQITFEPQGNGYRKKYYGVRRWHLLQGDQSRMDDSTNGVDHLGEGLAANMLRVCCVGTTDHIGLLAITGHGGKDCEQRCQRSPSSFASHLVESAIVAGAFRLPWAKSDTNNPSSQVTSAQVVHRNGPPSS